MKKKTRWWMVGILLLLLLLLLVGAFFLFFRKPQKEYFVRPEPTASSASASTTETYQSPVDFKSLQKKNADVYAWLDIPKTDISYPLFQHPTDDAYYLHRNIEKEYEFRGVLFTEATYNKRDFSDPLTIVYGHCMNNGDMFGTLQKEYGSDDLLAEHSEIVVYLPDRELHYTVFAATPYDSRHILYNYDFHNKRIFRLFFEDIVSTREIQSAFAEDTIVSPEDKTLILSTCLIGNRNKRFLVCGKLVQTIPSDLNIE